MALVSTLLLQLGLLGLLAYLLHLLLRRRALVGRLAWVPGPPALPLLGNLVDFCLSSQQEIFKKLHVYTKKYGSIYKIWMGPTPVIMCQDAELLQKILKNDDVVIKTDQYTILGKFLGDGLATMQTGDKWRLHRKSLMSSFHAEVYEYLATPTWKKALVLANFLLKFAKKGETVDLIQYLKLSTYDVTMKSVSGVDVNTLEGESSKEFLEIVDSFSQIVMRLAFLPPLSNEFIYNLTPMKKKEMDLRVGIDKFIEEVISKRREMLNNETKADTKQTTDLKERLIALDNLMRLNKTRPQEFSEKDVMDELTTLIFAGFDTMATSTSFTLFVLSHHPEYQEKLVKELDANVPNCLTEGFTLKDLSKLELLDRCFKESMRLFPPGVLMGRTLVSPVSLAGGTLPPGTDIYINFFGLHRNERVFPRPDEFQPDRFLAGEADRREPLSYMPFGAGSRICIGKKQAVFQAKIIISIILKKFYLVPVQKMEDLELMGDIVLKSKNGLKVKLRER